MAKNEDSLFKLIKSLSRTEKGYFKKSAFLHGPADKRVYIKLFEAMDGLKEYDEVFFKKKFQREPFLRHFSSTKKYLFQMILKALNAYHSSIRTEYQIQNILLSADILFKKGLFKEMGKMLNKAERLGASQHNHLLKLEVLHRRRRHIYRTGNFDEIEQFIKNFYSEARRCLQIEEDVIQCTILKYKIGNELRKKERIQYFRKTKKLVSEARKLEQRELSFYAKRTLYDIFIIHYTLSEDFLSAYKYAKKHVALIESDQGFIKEWPEFYIGTLHNLMYALANLKRYEEFWTVSNKMREVSRKYGQTYNELSRDQFLVAYGLELHVYVATGQFSKGIRSVSENWSESRLQRIRPEFMAIIYFNLSCLYFGAAEFRNALKWLSLFNNSSLKNTSPDLERVFVILNLMLHIELGHLDTFSYIIKSAQRFFFKQKEKYQYESIVLHFFSRFPNISSEKEKNKWFSEFKNALISLLKDQSEKEMLSKSMIIPWIESKITGKSMEVVMQC